MPELTRHGSSVQAVFDLLGASENDLTSALGFAVSRSPALLASVIRRVWPAAAAEQASLDLEVRGEVGRTDLEIALPGALVVLEPKRDWLLPSEQQLQAYAPRIFNRAVRDPFPGSRTDDSPLVFRHAR